MVTPCQWVVPLCPTRGWVRLSGASSSSRPSGRAGHFGRHIVLRSGRTSLLTAPGRVNNQPIRSSGTHIFEATEGVDTDEMEVAVRIITNGFSYCCGTDCAVEVVDRRGFGRSSPPRVGDLVGLISVAGWCDCILD
jgi:hypothetical protein